MVTSEVDADCVGPDESGVFLTMLCMTYWIFVNPSSDALNFYSIWLKEIRQQTWSSKPLEVDGRHF